MRLSRDVLKNLILKDKVVADYADLDGQLTANGFDCRLAGLIEIKEGGRLAINKNRNISPQLGRAYIMKGEEKKVFGYHLADVSSYSEGTIIGLEALRPYFAITCEQVNIPNNMMIDITSRSSLFRLTQSTLLCSFGEAGFEGYLTYILIPFLNSEIELGVRFSQISFSELKGQADYQNQAQANYQGGKLY